MLHHYHKNGNNINHGQWFFIVKAGEWIKLRYILHNALWEFLVEAIYRWSRWVNQNQEFLFEPWKPLLMWLNLLKHLALLWFHIILMSHDFSQTIRFNSFGRKLRYSGIGWSDIEWSGTGWIGIWWYGYMYLIWYCSSWGLNVCEWLTWRILEMLAHL